MSKISSLFLVEHLSHVDDLLRRNMRDQGEWIALGPGAMWALKREGISYKIPEDFCSNEEMGELCFRYHDKLKKFCNYADAFLHEKYPELKKWGMQPFLFHMFPLVNLIDGMVSRIFKLRAILNAYPNYKIWVHRAPPVPLHPWGVYGIVFSNKETLWGRLLSLGGWKNEIEFLKEPKTVTSSSFDMRLRAKLNEIKSYLLELLRSSLKESYVLNYLRFNIKSRHRGGLISRFVKERDSSLLFHSGIYNWAHTLPLLREKGYRIIFTNDQIFKSKINSKGKNLPQDLENLIKNNPQLMGVFDFDGISFYPFIRERVMWILKNSTQLCGKTVLKLKKIIGKYNVKAMLVAVSPTFISHAIQQAARYLGLPVICWQHGFITHNNGRITQLNEFNDMMTSDAVLTFGDEVTRAYSLYLSEFSSKVISVGSASIDKIRKANSSIRENFEKTILYVTTNYYQNLWYCGFYPPLNDRYLFKDQLTMMESLKEIVEDYQAKVTVKLSTATVCFDPPCIDNFSETFRIMKMSFRFADLILENHIIVIEAPTTVAIEATATKKPVFVLTNHISYPDSARKMLEKRAVCADNPKKLIDAIKDYIEHHIYPADVNNDEYLKAYGTYLDDGESDKRAVDKVLELIGARSNK